MIKVFFEDTLYMEQKEKVTMRKKDRKDLNNHSEKKKDRDKDKEIRQRERDKIQRKK